MADGDATRTVLLLDFPLRLMDRARQHRDALLREFAFLVHGRETSGVPARLLEIAAESDARYAGLNPESEDLCDEALARGDEYIDLELHVPDHFRQHIIDTVPVLLEVDEFCRSGQMLTLVPPDDLREFWVWYLLEFVRQIEGQPPIAWQDHPALLS